MLDVYSIKKFSILVGKSVKTLQRWDQDKKLIAKRTPTDRRYYTHDQYVKFLGDIIKIENKQIVVYYRKDIIKESECVQ